MRRLKIIDSECIRATRLFVYGIPYYVRNIRFLEELLSDIGNFTKSELLEDKSDRLDVLRIMALTNFLGLINRKIRACVDGE